VKKKKRFCISLCLLAAFALWTAAVCFVDVQPIGPQSSLVGFSTLNSWFHALTGVHPALYEITDWLSLIPLGIVVGFALLGLVQGIKRKSLFKVDPEILLLGGCYLLMLAAYLFFETVVVNDRPIEIGGVLEASYPSSTTLLVLCVMPTAGLQFHARIKHVGFRRWSCVFLVTFTAFMVLGRLISGVHWLTDIIGGVLLSLGLVMLYVAACTRK